MTTTGYLVPFPDRLMPVCRPCADLLGWFPLDHYQGTIPVIDDLLDGAKNRAEHDCANCKRPFRGGEKP